MNNLEKQLASVLAGRIGYDGFVRATQREFNALAGSLMRRWRTPAWHTPEDVVQDLYLGAWILLQVKKFDPTRGVTLARWVVYNAMSFAKREIHKARGAKLSGSADRNPSNYEKPLTEFGEHGDAIAEAILAEEPAAEQLMIEKQERDESVRTVLRACASGRERIAVRAIHLEGDVESAARMLYEDLDSRIALHLGSEEQAIKYVSRTARAVVERI